ncbi:MAG: DUF2124 family protein [Methanomicrobium sp.]|nr:DUF2124 family protein [Methanomicrobium sp.]
MQEIERYDGITGLLRPFKKYLEDLKLPAGSQVVFYGCSGTCLPIVELLAYAARTLPCRFIFVPFLSEEKAVCLEQVEDIGMQTVSRKTCGSDGAGGADGSCGACEPIKLDAAVAVIMGGLSMKSTGIPVADALKVISKYDCKRVGVCFMGFLEKEGWADALDLDLLIDATISPVRVLKKQD